MLKNIYLEGKNITIRPARLEDCRFFYKWEKKEYVQKFLSISKDFTYKDIISRYLTYGSMPTAGEYIIIQKEDDMPIGHLMLSRLDEYHKSIDITRIYIGEELALKKGYAKEALGMLLKLFFEHMKLERVTLDYFTGNTAVELYRKIGFKNEGIARNTALKNGKFYDLNIMSILRMEYFEGE